MYDTFRFSMSSYEIINYLEEIDHTFIKDLIFLNSLYQLHLAENDFFTISNKIDHCGGHNNKP